MQNSGKNWIIKRINGYFLFVALALTISVSLFMLDNRNSYEANVSLLLFPKSVKTAIELDKIKENIIILAEKNEAIDSEIKIKSEKKDSFIELSLEGENKVKITETLEKSTRSLASLTSKYYDIKNDLSLEVVSRQTVVSKDNIIFIVLVSLIVGSILSFIIQLLLDLIEKLFINFNKKRKVNLDDKGFSERKDLRNFLKINDEKIRKLSDPSDLISKREDFYEQSELIEKMEKKNTLEKKQPKTIVENEIGFKKASSPFNLPIDQDSFINEDPSVPALPVEKNEVLKSEEAFKDILNNNSDKKESAPEKKEIKKETFSQSVNENKEPTEAEFKKRLNQLLGNK